MPRTPSLSDRTVLNGILALVIATLFFAIQDAITKKLTDSLSAPQIALVRFFFFSLFALIYAHRTIGVLPAFRSKNLSLQIVRGLLISTEVCIFIIAIGNLGLAEIHTLIACFPLIATALSPWILGERIGWRRWAAVLMGFAGTLIILRPGLAEVNPYVLVALLCAAMFALYNLLTRKVARIDPFQTSLVYFGLTGLIVCLFVAPFFWQPISSDDIFWLLIISATTVISHILLIKALELAPAVVLQPFNYLVLVWAIAIGFIVFGETLDVYSIAGGLIVVLSGLFIANREYQNNKINRD